MILAVAAQLVGHQCTFNHHYIFVFLNQKELKLKFEEYFSSHTDTSYQKKPLVVSTTEVFPPLFLQAATNCVESPALACTLASLLSPSIINGPSRDPWKPDWKLDNVVPKPSIFRFQKRVFLVSWVCCSMFCISCWRCPGTMLREKLKSFHKRIRAQTTNPTVGCYCNRIDVPPRVPTRTTSRRLPFLLIRTRYDNSSTWIIAWWFGADSLLKSSLGVQLFDVATIDQTLRYAKFHGAWRQPWRMYRMAEFIDSNQAFERHSTFRIENGKYMQIDANLYIFNSNQFFLYQQDNFLSSPTPQRPFFLRHSAMPRTSIHGDPSCSPIDSTMPLSKPATLKNLPGCRGRRFAFSSFHDSRLQSGAFFEVHFLASKSH